MTIARTWRQLRIVYGALLASLAMYGVTAIQGAAAPPPQDTSGQLDPLLLVSTLAGCSALVLFVVIPVLRAKLLPPRIPAGEPYDLTGAADARLQVALKKLRNGMIATWALCEAIAIWGLIPSLLYQDVRYYFAFAAACLIAMIYFAPRQPVLASRLPAPVAARSPAAL